MAHYAFLDNNNVVVNVIVGKDENEDGIDWEQHYGELVGLSCKRTSYNTSGNSHPTKEPFRKNYASVGYTYSETLDGFIPPTPYPSWVLNEDTCRWESPIPYPTDEKYYLWDEETVSWVLSN
jgi:hypothetical protein